MIQRIKDTVGISPLNISDFQIDGINKTIIDFQQELTSGEKALLDQVMADSPTLPPTNFAVRFVINDIYEKLAQFNSTAGVNFRLYFSQSAPPTGAIDLIELHSSTSLTNQQKNTVKSAFSAMIREG